MDTNYTPKTLQEALTYFANANTCIQFLAARRWPKGAVCPTCGGKKVRFLATRRIWECKAKHPKRQFSIKVGTIFEDSALPLSKWLVAIWMVANCKNGISSYEIHRALGITQKSAWFVLHRIHLAMHTSFFTKLSGEIEADETYIGGKARNMHADKRKKRITSNGPLGKAAIMGLLARHGEIRAKVLPVTNQSQIRGAVKEHFEAGTELFTDAHPAYFGLDAEYIHGVIDHAESYAEGKIHTNGLENFWGLLKRGLKGTYIAVEPFHLFRYLDEQVFRYNHRKDANNQPLKDADRFQIAIDRIAGKRLTYRGVTGKNIVDGAWLD